MADRQVEEGRQPVGEAGGPEAGGGVTVAAGVAVGVAVCTGRGFTGTTVPGGLLGCTAGRAAGGVGSGRRSGVRVGVAVCVGRSVGVGVADEAGKLLAGVSALGLVR